MFTNNKLTDRWDSLDISEWQWCLITVNDESRSFSSSSCISAWFDVLIWRPIILTLQVERFQMVHLFVPTEWIDLWDYPVMVIVQKNVFSNCILKGMNPLRMNQTIGWIGSSERSIGRNRNFTVFSITAWLFLFTLQVSVGVISDASSGWRWPSPEVPATISSRPGRSGKIRFRLVASTCNWYQAEVRGRTFLHCPSWSVVACYKSYLRFT